MIFAAGVISQLSGFRGDSIPLLKDYSTIFNAIKFESQGHNKDFLHIQEMNYKAITEG